MTEDQNADLSVTAAAESLESLARGVDEAGDSDGCSAGHRCLEDGENGHASKHEDWSAADSCGSSEDATWRQACPHYWAANKKFKKRAQLWKGKGQFTTQKAGTT
ncbi:unnamed protein product [Arctogadus glacialis]